MFYLNILVPRAERLKRLKARRKLWLEVHLWLGLALGLFMAIFGITGSILVFHAEINELLNPTLLTCAVPPSSPTFQPLAEIFRAGQQIMPSDAQHTFSNYPRNKEAAFKLNYSVPVANGVTESWEVYVDPYTAKVIGKRLMTSSDGIIPKTFIGFLFELHYALLRVKRSATR